MIREPVTLITDERNVHVINRVWAINELLNTVRSPRELWPIDALDSTYKFVWRTSDVTVACALVIALGEYAIKTKDQLAINILQKLMKAYTTNPFTILH